MLCLLACDHQEVIIIIKFLLMMMIEERRKKNRQNRGRTSQTIQVKKKHNRKAGGKVKGTTTCKGWSTNESSFANASIFDKSLNIGSNQEVFRNEFIAHNFFSNHCHLLVYLRCFPALIFYKMGGHTQFSSQDVTMSYTLLRSTLIFCLQKYIFKTDKRKPSTRRHCIV